MGGTDGVCVNTERRVQRLRQAVPPHGNAKPDWWIVTQIARRLGIPGFEFESAKDVFNELCELSPIYAGLDWIELKTLNTCGLYRKKTILARPCCTKANL